MVDPWHPLLGRHFICHYRRLALLACFYLGTFIDIANEIKQLGNVKQPYFLEKSFESPLYSRPGFRNLSNQWLAARQD